MAILGITFDVARTLMYLENSRTHYKELSDFLVQNDVGLYPQELRAAREFVFMVDLGKYAIDNWFDWSKQILYRLDYTEVPPLIINGMSEILRKSVDEYRLYDDVKPVVSKLHDKGFQLSCLTTIPEFKLRKVMEPIREYLTHIIHGGNAGCAKGNPRMYKLDLEWKGVKAQENLFVGDDHLYDIEYPHNLGMTTVHIERELDYPKEMRFSNFQIPNLKELLPIVSKLSN